MGAEQRVDLGQTATPGRVVGFAVVIFRTNACGGFELVHGVMACGHRVKNGFFVHLAAVTHEDIICGIKYFRCRGAGAALSRLVRNGFPHQGNIGLIPRDSAFSFHIGKSAVNNGLQVKSKIRPRHAQHSGDFSGNQAVRGIFDQKPENGKPGLGSQDLKDGNGCLCLYYTNDTRVS